MKAVDATRILLHRGKLTNKLRKQCQRARETTMLSATPIYKDGDEYFSSKASEVTPEQRLAARLRRATLVQLHKWARRNLVRESACRGVVSRTESDRLRDKFTILAGKHEGIKSACLTEIARRKDKACGN